MPELTTDPGWPTAPGASARHLGAGHGPRAKASRRWSGLPFDVRPERCVRYGDSDASRQLAGERLVKGAKAIGLIA